MPSNRKIGREKKKKVKKSGAFSLYVRNKWNGKEPYAEFQKREIKLWSNLPSQFKMLTKVRTKGPTVQSKAV